MSTFCCPSCGASLTITPASPPLRTVWPEVTNAIPFDGSTVRDVAQRRFDTDKPRPAEMERARRWLYRQVQAGAVRVTQDSDGMARFWLTGAPATD